ncbi:MAG: hypothetical protein JWO87_3267, partial [Phycisphaerales bacterium]|nr:hypothetical protein [Phycisphaerales bacterium]
SAILMSSHVPPQLHGLSIPGVLGYFLAIALGLRALWKNRERRLSGRDNDYD